MSKTIFFVLSALVALTSAAAIPTASAPFKLPATYATGGLANSLVTMNADGTFSYTSQVACFKAPCPEQRGEGKWKYSTASKQLALVMPASADGSQAAIKQTWQMVNIASDANQSEVAAKWVSGSTGAPIPHGSTKWVRA
ncbi:hypothetical protein BC828DRAFT_400133 [Blastocladiella britannica]|nr:hypothetical protein BC828DRAFT_400133 [Blastocladiella britannica]